jgi:transmembrane sensor
MATAGDNAGRDDKKEGGEDRASTEAARWLVALEDDPENASLRARFEDWRQAGPENAQAWADTSDIYDTMARTTPVHGGHWAPYVSRRRADRRDGSPPRRAPLRRRVAFGAVAALAAGLALVFVPDVLLRMQADYVTATAQSRILTLQDGSIVRLGPGSAVDIAFTETERRVRLLKGEAFFEVTANPDRAFRVSARDVETTVLGTAFNVRLGEDVASIGVRHGKVRVDYGAVAPPVSERLGAGEWVRVAWNGRVERRAGPPDRVAPWLQGQLVARDDSLNAMVDALRRYYPGVIVMADAALGKKRVTGVYNLADPVAALRAIAGAHGASVRRISPWILLVSGG